MTSIDPQNYELVFQAHADGSATVEGFQLLPTVPMPVLHFQQNDNISMRILGPDGTSSSMKSVQIDFKAKSADAPSPLGDGEQANFLWRSGQQYTHTGKACGIWNFAAVLTGKDGQQYVLKNDANVLPEFQVGDGS